MLYYSDVLSMYVDCILTRSGLKVTILLYMIPQNHNIYTCTLLVSRFSVHVALYSNFQLSYMVASEVTLCYNYIHVH